jgi:co-chaperonin GroES (HSP10)
MSSLVTPLRGRVVIRELRPDRTGSIWHPDQSQDPRRDEKSHRGIVMAVGAPMLSSQTEGAVEVPHGFRAGDVVHFVFYEPCAERGRTTIWDDDEPVVWLTQSEIIAVEESDDWGDDMDEIGDRLRAILCAPFRGFEIPLVFPDGEDP